MTRFGKTGTGSIIMPQVTANGKTYSIDQSVSLESFLNRLEIHTKWVVVERNGEPVSRNCFAQTQLQDGDKLEIVTPIAGG